MSDLYLDFETRSTLDLKKVGVHVYAAHPSTAVWCACWAIDDGEINTWLPGDKPPLELVTHVRANGQIHAHNAAFERLIWAHIMAPRHYWTLPEFEQWHCTLARAWAMALPGTLEHAALAAGIDKVKSMEGHRTMMQMAKPRSLDDKGNPIWWSDAQRQDKLVAYCKQDVEVERALDKRLNQLRAQERAIWLLDQKINDRGVLVDKELCEIALPLVEQALIQLNAEIVEVSKGIVPSVNAVAKIAEFCRLSGLYEVDSVDANAIEVLLLRELPADVRRVLEIRQAASKASVAKIATLLKGTNSDGRARGLLAYHAASTGRWAGRRFQPQNLKRPVYHDQDNLIELIRTKSPRIIEMLAGPVLDVVSDVLRGLIIAPKGKLLYAADYSNIEGRALAWLAGESWKLKAFQDFDNGTGPDLYRLAYAKSFHIPLEKVTSDQRQVGKVLELSMGYQGGIGAFQTMAAGYRVKVSDETADELKTAWRKAHPNIVAFWPAMEVAAINAVQNPGKVFSCGRLAFRTVGSFLYMRLPSGRALCYPYPKIMMTTTPWGSKKASLTYKTVVGPNNASRIIESDSSTWARISVYGGLLAENATQAVARDVMAEAMLRLEAAGFPVILTVHDEIVCETSGREVDEFQMLMETPPEWSEGFPIVATAWCGDRYKKD